MTGEVKKPFDLNRESFKLLREALTNV